MFENIRLISRRDNKISDPNASWDTKTKIYCCCDLNLGLGEKMSWTPHNAIPLRNLIEFYNLLENSASGSAFQYAFKHNESVVTFFWTKLEKRGLYLTIRHKLESKYFPYDEEIFRSLAWRRSYYKDDLYLTVMRVLTAYTINEVCIKVAALFYKNSEHYYEFTRGQKVKTILGPNVKTPRIGHVIDRGYHENDKTNLYFLMVNGEVLTKRYLPGDLEKI
jgi:hypothetical protein